MEISPTFTAATPQVFSFSDVDEFRNSVRGWEVDITPLSKTIAARQTILRLSGCDLIVVRSFPRLLDMKLSPDCTVIAFAMDDGVPVKINGVDYERAAYIAVGNSGAACSVVERSSRTFAFVVFTPEILDREWPVCKEQFLLIDSSEAVVRSLQQLVSEILYGSHRAENQLERELVSVAIKESLVAAIDAALSTKVESGKASVANLVAQYKVFQSIQAVIVRDLGGPIYSAELASQVGVSVRTLHNAIRRYRGMSLHRYLRLRRLWLVRQRLLAGANSVKSTALTMGFWHLGDFSRSYRFTFGETPSETLTRSK